MSGFRKYLATYLHRERRVPSAYRDKANPAFYVCKEIFPATDEMQVVRQVKELGGMLVAVRVARQRRIKLSQDYRVKFLTAIHFSVQSGLSAGAALEQQISAESYPQREYLEPALRVLRAGASFSEAMAIMGAYDDITLSILAAGEETGTLPQSLEAAIAHQQRKSTTDALMRTALLMLTADIVTSFLSIASTRFVMLPQTAKQGIQSTNPEDLEKWETALRWAFLSNEILLGLTGLIAVFAYWSWWQYKFGNAKDKAMVDRWINAVPFLGKALLHSAVAGSSAVMAQLLRGGVQFLKAASITANSSKHVFVRNYWEEATRSVAAGAPLATALSTSPMTPAEQRVLGAHGNQEHLAKAFSQISEFRQGQSDSSNKRFMLVAVAGGFIYSSLGIAILLYVNWLQISAAVSSANI